MIDLVRKSLLIVTLLIGFACSSWAQQISNTRIDQLSHHTEERFAALKGTIAEIEQTCSTDTRGNYKLTFQDSLLVEVEERTKEQKFYNKIRYEYDEQGRRTKGEKLSADDKLRVMWEYSYDSNLYPATLNYDGKLAEEYTYDQNNRLISVETKNYNQTISITRGDYTLNEQGSPKEIKVYLDEELVAKYYYEYFENGDLRSFTKFRVKGNTSNEYYFAYEYDAKGNWVKRTVEMFYVNNNDSEKSKFIRKHEYTRTITYR